MSPITETILKIVSVPIATGSTERKFAEPTIFSAIPNASAEMASVYYMAILSKSKFFTFETFTFLSCYYK